MVAVVRAGPARIATRSVAGVVFAYRADTPNPSWLLSPLNFPLRPENPRR